MSTLHALALGAALVAGCQQKSRVVVVSSPDTFDPVIRRAIVENKVTTIVRPAPESAPLVELGEALFHDPILSGNRDIACASCHQGPGGLSDGLPVAVGAGASGKFPNRQKGSGVLIPRNAPALFNIGLPVHTSMFHDDRVARDPATGILHVPIAELNIPVPFPPVTEAEKLAAQVTTALAGQALFPVQSREEMRGVSSTADDNELGDVPDDDPFEVWRRIVVRLIGAETSPGSGTMAPANPTQTAYRQLFQAAYPATPLPEINYGHAARAIASYEREDFSSLGSAWDRYVAGDNGALTVIQKRGALTFYGKTKKGKCANCHAGPLLSDLLPHALAIPQIGPGAPLPGDAPLEDRGRAKVTGLATDDYKFRTPALRNVARSGPYFHNGAYATLREVMIHYNDIESGIRTYETRVFPELDPSLGIPYDDDAGRIDARVQASKNEGLLPQTLGLTESEVDELIAFMESLTDETFADAPPASVPSGLPVGGN